MKSIKGDSLFCHICETLVIKDLKVLSSAVVKSDILCPTCGNVVIRKPDTKC